MKIFKSNGQISAYISGAIVSDNSVRFTWTAELQEDFKDDPNAITYYIEGRPAYIIVSFPAPEV